MSLSKETTSVTVQKWSFKTTFGQSQRWSLFRNFPVFPENLWSSLASCLLVYQHIDKLGTDLSEVLNCIWVSHVDLFKYVVFHFCMVIFICPVFLAMWLFRCLWGFLHLFLIPTFECLWTVSEQCCTLDFYFSLLSFSTVCLSLLYTCIFFCRL